MHVFLLNYEYPPIGGGAATATEQIAMAMVRQGHAVTVITAAFLDLPGEADAQGVRVIRVPALRRQVDRSSILEMFSYLVSAFFRLPRLVRRFRPDACLCFFSLPCGPLGWLLKRCWGIPYVIALRGGDVPGAEPHLARFHQAMRPFRRAVLRGALAVVANSQGLRGMSERADPIPVAVIPNGVDCVRFSPAPEAIKSGDTFRFLFVGRLNHQKNVPLLINALAKLHAEGFACKLAIVGDGPLLHELKGQALRVGVDPHVSWLGWLPREKIVEAYRQADCLINPSRYEGMPNVVLEAMACGLPVIASDVPGNRDVIEPGVSGSLFADGAEDDLVRLMASTIKDPVAASDLGRQARAMIVSNYSWDSVALGYARLLASRA